MSASRDTFSLIYTFFFVPTKKKWLSHFSEKKIFFFLAELKCQGGSQITPKTNATGRFALLGAKNDFSKFFWTLLSSSFLTNSPVCGVRNFWRPLDPIAKNFFGRSTHWKFSITPSQKFLTPWKNLNRRPYRQKFFSPVHALKIFNTPLSKISYPVEKILPYTLCPKIFLHQKICLSVDLHTKWLRTPRGSSTRPGRPQKIWKFFPMAGMASKVPRK